MSVITSEEETRIRASYDLRDRLNALADATDRTQHGMLHHLIEQEERRRAKRKERHDATNGS